MKQSWKLGKAKVTIDFDPQHTVVETEFEGAEPITAIPRLDQQSLAKELGYKNINQLTQEHDFLHSWLALQMGKQYSPNLYNVAFPGTEPDDKKRAEEEGLVLAFQRYMNTGDYDGNLWPLVVPYLEELKRKAIDELRKKPLRMVAKQLSAELHVKYTQGTLSVAIDESNNLLYIYLHKKVKEKFMDSYEGYPVKTKYIGPLKLA